MINRVLDLNLLGTQITDERHIDVGAGLLVLGHSTFFGGVDLVIRTVASGGGTLLVENTDYICQNQDTTLTTQTGKPVYTALTITNVAYQTGSLYISYKSVGDYVNASLLNELYSNIYHRNRLINGNFDPVVGWQRGTSFTLNSAETQFTADRYRCTQGTGGVGTVSLQTVTPAAVPGARGSLRWQQTTAATTAPEIMQPIEGADTFANTICTRGFWAKAAASMTIQVALRQNFGTGGTPSASVDIAAQSFTIGTAWQFIQATFTVPDTSAKTFGTNVGTDYLGARIILPASVTFDIQFTLDQLELENMATDFEWRQPREQLADQQRYFEKSFPLNIAPGPNSIFYQNFNISGTASGIDAYSAFTTQFKVTKRVTPSITTYNATAANTTAAAYMRDDGTWYNGYHSGAAVCDESFTVNGSYAGAGSVTTNRSIAFNWTADAEFYN